jgi:hypothetical protein
MTSMKKNKLSGASLLLTLDLYMFLILVVPSDDEHKWLLCNLLMYQ